MKTNAVKKQSQVKRPIQKTKHKSSAVDTPEETVDPELLARMKSDKVTVPQDKLDNLNAQCRYMRDLTLEIKQAEERIAEKQRELTKLSMETLPELFAEYNIPSITIGAEGNLPEMTMERKPFYKAVLPEESEPGLRWLEKNKAGDLIKRVFTVKLPLDSAKQAVELRKIVRRLDLAYEERETVPWTTLTAFVKERIEKLKKPVPLDILGATVGHIVKVKRGKANDAQ